MVSYVQFVPDTFPAGQGEPLNAIITGNSDERVLQQTETDGGLLNYFMCVLAAGLRNRVFAHIYTHFTKQVFWLRRRVFRTAFRL